MKKITLFLAFVLMLGSSTFAQKVVTGPNLSAGNYEIVHESGLNFDIAGPSKEPGTKVIVWARHGKWNQVFRPVEAPDGTYYIMNEESGKFLDIEGGNLQEGSRLQIWKGNSTIAQRFRFHNAVSGYYYIEVSDTDLYLATEKNPAAKGNKIILVNKSQAGRWRLNKK